MGSIPTSSTPSPSSSAQASILMDMSIAETMTGCGERLEAGTVDAVLGSTQTGTGVTNGAARVQVLLLAARSTADLELSRSPRHWPSKTSSSTGQVNPTGPE